MCAENLSYKSLCVVVECWFQTALHRVPFFSAEETPSLVLRD